MSTYHKNPEAVSRLSPEQDRVTQWDGTERPFDNAYWDNKEPGIYVDVVSGEPLFASIDKFDSSSGRPSFAKPIEPENVVENRDDSHGVIRTEISSNHGGSHLGRVFPDGPSEAGGLRYCINSASLHLFISITWRARAAASGAKLFEARRSNAVTVLRDGQSLRAAVVFSLRHEPTTSIVRITTQEPINRPRATGFS